MNLQIKNIALKQAISMNEAHQGSAKLSVNILE